MLTEPVDVVCTAPEFKALRCPYTGDPLEVRMLVVPGSPPRFHAPDAYSPAIPRPTPDEAYRLWNRVDGVEGLKSDTPVVCAYTGVPLSPAHCPDGYFFNGGFDPRMFHSREGFLRLASSRGGVSPRSGADSRVEAVPPDMTPEKPRKTDTDPTDEALHIAEKVLEKHRDDLPPQASTTVSMSTGRRRGR